MARLEKTVFISYRRADVFTALAVYESLKNDGYDVFFDYISISSGDFEQIITSNIRARAHFLLILTPTALDRCNEPGDWLRREVELAIDEKRNIVPLLFKGFHFSNPSVADKLVGKLENLHRYNGLNVHEDYFDEAIQRLQTKFLNIPLDTVLHPVSTEVRRAVKEDQVAADKALEQIVDVKALVSHDIEEVEVKKLESQAIQFELKGDFSNALQTYYKIKKIDPQFPRVDIKIEELRREFNVNLNPGMRERKEILPQLFPRLIAVFANGVLLLQKRVIGNSAQEKNRSEMEYVDQKHPPTKYKISVACTKLLSKRFASPFLIQFYLPSARVQVDKNLFSVFPERKKLMNMYR